MECQSEYFTLAGVALGALIGALATLFAARLSWQRFRYNEAAAKFRSAFTHEIYRLRKANEDVYKILSDDVFERHEKAKIVFERVVMDIYGRLPIVNQKKSWWYP